ncbi:DUF1697 domain-containing protein [Loktanella sp. F6476L]|uniref:DUF1697 domain-containing protein n=1 Tax=Loktanella sp. F6476L TaxID=2926405 RepID=UPI001FF236B5|nr:DUF1697 domain-containing protein [Loktanella sp. F6476L]MCK0119172.1 DUF1697 domain-containing protein [Loktanella sp. F6476L]
MNRYVGLLRAVNVGGTGKLPMADLRAMCADIGFIDVATYIASGNVVFSSALDVGNAKAKLEQSLAQYAGKAVPVMIRTADEMAAVLAANPYADAAGNKVVTIFCDDLIPTDAATRARNIKDEAITLGSRDIYVHYPRGQGGSKLMIPAAAAGTARNMNTVAKLVAMTGR